MATPSRLQQILRGPPASPPTSPLRPLGRTGGATEKWKSLEEQGFGGRSILFDSQDSAREATYSKNIENYIGTVKVPIGLAGPLRIKEGSFAKGDFYIPLATTEAALVASVSRGLRTMLEAGGCTTLYIDEGVQRVPIFEFLSLADLHTFRVWMSKPETRVSFDEVIAGVTKHGKLLDYQFIVEGNRLQVRLEYRTGDASGQNMVTFMTNALLKHIRRTTPVHIVDSVIEAGGSSDKKGSHISLQNVRGRRVVAQAVIPESVVKSLLHTTPRKMAHHRQRGWMVHHMIGALGTSHHASNVLTAIYIATGQDAACAAESHVGFSRMEVMPDGSLYASITLPAVLCATVGGGTSLPSQDAALSLLRTKDARALAEICAAASLAGELSIVAAFCSEEFAAAHYNLSRGVPQNSKL